MSATKRRERTIGIIPSLPARAYPWIAGSSMPSMAKPRVLFSVPLLRRPLIFWPLSSTPLRLVPLVTVQPLPGACADDATVATIRAAAGEGLRDRQQRTGETCGMAAIPDSARKFGLVLKACNLGRGRMAQTIGMDKSVVSRRASGVQVPADHNLSLLTETIARHKTDFGHFDWDFDTAAFAARLAVAVPESASEQTALALSVSVLSPPDLPSIVVLPRSLFVIARNSSFTYRGRAP